MIFSSEASENIIAQIDLFVATAADTDSIAYLIMLVWGASKALVSACRDIVNLIDATFNGEAFAINEVACLTDGAIKPILACLTFASAGNTDHIDEIETG